VLVVAETAGVAWPGGASYTLQATASVWEELESDAGLLAGRRLRVEVEGRGAAARSRAGELARAG
jgi:hypothetical protein